MAAKCPYCNGAGEIRHRLEEALRIALKRAHGDNAAYAAQLIETLETDADVPNYAPRPYQGWQDAKRLVNQIEALEASEGIQHVRVKQPGSYLDMLYSLPSQELKCVFQDALCQGDSYTADLAQDILCARENMGLSICPACGGSGCWGHDIPCGRCGGWGQ